MTEGFIHLLGRTWLPTSGTTWGQTLTFGLPKRGEIYRTEELINESGVYPTGCTFPQRVDCRIVYNDTGSTITARKVVQWTDNADEYGIGVKLPADDVHRTRLAGVTLVDIPNGYCGYVVCKGYTKCTSNAALTAKALIGGVVTTGKVDDASPADDEVIGYCHTAASGADEDVLCFVDFP